MQWYVSQHGKTSGPFAEERIAMLVNWGKISRDAYICDEQWSCWVSITQSQFAPLLAERDGEAVESQHGAAPPPPPSTWDDTYATRGWVPLQHRMALAVLLMIAAIAFLLMLWFNPARAARPPGGENVVQLLAAARMGPVW